jgi:hypothetical protein
MGLIAGATLHIRNVKCATARTDRRIRKPQLETVAAHPYRLVVLLGNREDFHGVFGFSDVENDTLAAA